MKNNRKILFIGLLMVVPVSIKSMQYRDYDPNRSPVERAIEQRRLELLEEQKRTSRAAKEDDDNDSVRAVREFGVNPEIQALQQQYMPLISRYLGTAYNNTAEQKYANIIQKRLRQLQELTFEGEEKFLQNKDALIQDIQKIQNGLDRWIVQKNQLQDFLRIAQQYSDPKYVYHMEAQRLLQHITKLLAEFSQHRDSKNILHTYLIEPRFIQAMQRIQTGLLIQEQDDDGSDTSSVDTVIHEPK